MNNQKYPTYDGIIGRNALAGGPEVHRAWASWKQQKQRCYNPKNNRYAWVGAKGIEVEYTLREFIGWWLIEIAKRPHWRRPTCGRIDHDQNYRLDNIRLEEASENTAEMNARRREAREFDKILAITPDGTRLNFDCVTQAARCLGIEIQLFRAHLSGKIESPISQWVFRYSNMVARSDQKG